MKSRIIWVTVAELGLGDGDGVAGDAPGGLAAGTGVADAGVSAEGAVPAAA